MKLCKCKGNCTKIFRDVIIWLGMAAACYFMIKGFTCSISNRVNSIHIKSINHTPMLFKISYQTWQTVVCVFLMALCLLIGFVCYWHFKYTNKARLQSIKTASVVTMRSEAEDILRTISNIKKYDKFCAFQYSKVINTFCDNYRHRTGVVKHINAILSAEDECKAKVRSMERVRPFPMDKIRYITE